MSHGGSRNRGSGHWRAQRLGALLIIPLGIWFIAALLLLPDFHFQTLHDWAAAPWRAVLLGALVLVIAWHSKLGVHEVIEDYAHAPAVHAVLRFLNTGLHLAAAAAGVIAVARLAF